MAQTTASRESLISQIKSFQAILEINQKMISSFDIEELYHIVLTEAQTLTQASAASILLIDEEKQVLKFVASTDLDKHQMNKIEIPVGKGISGYVAETGKIVNMANVQEDGRFYQNVDLTTGETTKSYICVPLMVQGKLIGTAQIMNRIGGAAFSNTEERIIEAFASQAAIAIQTAHLHKEAMQKKVIERDLNLAKEIQESSLPNEILKIEGYSLYASTLPARTVGGDYYYYDIKTFHGKQYLDIVIADVSGKGVGAALIVAYLHTALDLLLPRYRNVGEFGFELNNYLKKNLIIGKFVTLFICRIDINSGKGEYINCGHNPPYIISKRSQKITAKILKLSGQIMGLTQDAQYEEFSFKLHEGDLLFLYTDGVVEAQNQREELYGEERMLKIIAQFIKNHNLSSFSHELERALRKDIKKHRDGYEANDDTTIQMLYRVKS